jgi:hypothetical protein
VTVVLAVSIKQLILGQEALSIGVQRLEHLFKFFRIAHVHKMLSQVPQCILLEPVLGVELFKVAQS